MEKKDLQPLVDVCFTKIYFESKRNSGGEG